MIYILVPLLAVFLGMTLFSLIRGLNAFRTSLDEKDAETGGTGATELQLFQNKMMWARIKYQALAVVVVFILLAISR